MLEVRVSGRKTFYQRYIDARGSERQYKIGSANVISITQAKQKARLVCAEALLGPDPQQRRRDIRSIPTLSQLVQERYLPHVMDYKRSWKTDETILRLHILPDLGSLHLDEVRDEHISDLVRRMRLKGYAAGTTNRVVVMLRYIFNLARRWKLLPAAHENPTAGISLAHTPHRERFLTDVETKRLLRAIAEEENVVAGRAIMLLLLTGARRNEITQARWEWIDWERCTLLVPIAKSGKPRHVCLNAPALDLIRTIDRKPGNPYLFPSPRTGRPSPSLFYSWNRIRRRADLPGVRLHDLRHSFASYLVNRGVSLYIVQGLLGHTQIKTTQRYAHLQHETLQEASEMISAVIT